MRIGNKSFGALMAVALVSLPGAASAKWVASWTAAPHAPLGTTGPFAAAAYENVTLTQIVRITEGGDKVRVTFSNRYGPGPLAIGAARIFRIDDAGKEIAGTSRTLTFSGDASAVIPRAAPFVTDPVALTVPSLSRLKVEFYLPKPTGPCTCHLTGQDELAVSPPGNFVGKPFEPVSKAQYRAFLSGVEVDSAKTLGTIVAYGDSITDGVGSTPGKNTRWPDILANRLQAAGKRWAVANQADRRLTLEWRELDGPPVVEPDRRGFGTRLIERNIRHDLAGDVKLQYPTDGFHAEMSVPLDRGSPT